MSYETACAKLKNAKDKLAAALKAGDREEIKRVRKHKSECQHLADISIPRTNVPPLRTI